MTALRDIKRSSNSKRSILLTHCRRKRKKFPGAGVKPAKLSPCPPRSLWSPHTTCKPDSNWRTARVFSRHALTARPTWIWIQVSSHVLIHWYTHYYSLGSSTYLLSHNPSGNGTSLYTNNTIHEPWYAVITGFGRDVKCDRAGWPDRVVATREATVERTSLTHHSPALDPMRATTIISFRYDFLSSLLVRLYLPELRFAPLPQKMLY